MTAGGRSNDRRRSGAGDEGAKSGAIAIWRTPDPAGFVGRLEALELTAGDRPIGERNRHATVARLDVASGRQDELVVDERPPDGGGDPRIFHPSIRLLAIGFATVELERWGRVSSLPPDVLLGARAAWLGEGPELGPSHALPKGASPPGAADSLPTVLLEPYAEGRTAAALARGGERPIVLYVLASASAAGTAPAPAEPAGQSPFGPATIVVGSRYGPFLIACRPVDERPDRVPSPGTWSHR